MRTHLMDAVAQTPRLYWYQADAMFKVMLKNAWGPNGPQINIDPGHGQYALYLVYQMIEQNPNITDRSLIYNMKRKFNITSQVTNICLKALETVFDCLNVVTYHENQSRRNSKTKNCKRYQVTENSLISEWCSGYEENHPDIRLMKNVLSVVH